MGREYKILCKPMGGADLQHLLLQLPPPFKRSQMVEIYNYAVQDDGYYFIDHLVDRKVAASGFQIFLDAALSNNEAVTVIEP
ncbi:MAG: hypothetical protein V4726_01920 [Verrucomicrobiota bacterium]